MVTNMLQGTMIMISFEFLIQYLAAQLNTFITDIYPRPGDELSHLMLGFIAK
jgi:hypothetical protein